MASELPTTENEFLSISGVGTNKMEKYGDDFMDIIRKYKNVAKPRKQSTTLKTFELYQQGLKPIAIAKERNLSITTIYSHLSQLQLTKKEDLK